MGYQIYYSGYQIYYSDRDVVDLIHDIDKVNSEISDMVNDYLYDATNKLTRIKDTIKIISKYQSDNEGWRDDNNSEKTQKKLKETFKNLSEEEYYKEYQKHLVFLDKKYPEYDGDSYASEKVEKDLQEAWKFENEIEKSIEKLKELISKLEKL